MNEKGVYIAAIGFNNKSEGSLIEIKSKCNKAITDKCIMKLTRAIHKIACSPLSLVFLERNF